MIKQKKKVCQIFEFWRTLIFSQVLLIDFFARSFSIIWRMVGIFYDFGRPLKAGDFFLN